MLRAQTRKAELALRNQTGRLAINGALRADYADDRIRTGAGGCGGVLTGKFRYDGGRGRKR